MASREVAVYEAPEGEITPINASFVTAIDRAQMDALMATARQFPRDILKAKREALTLVTLDQETAAEMHYRLERKEAGGGVKEIEGETIRFAEIIQYAWGGLRVESRIVGADETHVTAQGTCIDLERGNGARVEIKRRITDKKGRRYSDDMITQTGNAAASIARRNAIFAVVPKALWKNVSDAARTKALGGGEPIEARRSKALSWFARQGKSEADLLALLEVESVQRITEDHLQRLTQLRNAIQGGDSTIEETFGGPEPKPAATSPLNAKVGA